MKRKVRNLILVVASVFTLNSCAELVNVLLTNPNNVGGILNQVAEPKSVIDDIISAVMGNTPLTKEAMVGKWSYTGTSVAFETENYLKKAGGKVASLQAERKFNDVSRKVGLSAQNTYFIFNKDNTYKAIIRGIPLAGSYTIDAKSKKVKLTYLLGLGSLDATVVLSGSRMQVMFDADSILKIVKIAGQVTGDSNLKVLGDMAEMYDGMLLGFRVNR